jgi:hypothetical protein
MGKLIRKVLFAKGVVKKRVIKSWDVECNLSGKKAAHVEK